MGYKQCQEIYLLIQKSEDRGQRSEDRSQYKRYRNAKYLDKFTKGVIFLSGGVK